jgi:hypothetical protein
MLILLGIYEISYLRSVKEKFSAYYYRSLFCIHVTGLPWQPATSHPHYGQQLTGRALNPMLRCKTQQTVSDSRSCCACVNIPRVSWETQTILFHYQTRNL